jgi:hypothetical protein
MFGFLCSVALSSCAVIEDVRADGEISRTVVFASPVNLPATPPDRGRVLKITGLGVAATNETVNFGFFNSSEMHLDPRCQVVLVGNTDEELKRFAKLIPNMQNICSDVIPAGGKK